MSDVTTTVPASILPAGGPDEAEFLADVLRDVTAQVNAHPGRDAAALDQAVRQAYDRVGQELDRSAPWAARDQVPMQVYGAVKVAAASFLKRVGSAYGVVGYDDVDPMATRALAAALADVRPLKERWGLS